MRSDPGGERADEDAADQQYDMGHVVKRHGAAAKLRRRVGLNDRLRQGVGSDMDDADKPHQDHRYVKPRRDGEGRNDDAVQGHADQHDVDSRHAIAE